MIRRFLLIISVLSGLVWCYFAAQFSMLGEDPLPAFLIVISVVVMALMEILPRFRKTPNTPPRPIVRQRAVPRTSAEFEAPRASVPPSESSGMEILVSAKDIERMMAS